MYCDAADRVEPMLRFVPVESMVTVLVFAPPARSNGKDSADHGEMFFMQYDNMSLM